MSANLIWIKPEEGRAFYTEEGKIYFLEPLYNKAVLTTEQEMTILVAREGYEQVKQPFHNFREIADYVSEQYEQIRKSEGGLDIPTDAQLEEAVAGARDETLLNYLNRAIEKWIPDGNLLGAKKLLSDIIHAARRRQSQELFKAAKELNRRIKENEAETTKVVSKSLSFDVESGELVVGDKVALVPELVVVDQIYTDGFYGGDPTDDSYVVSCMRLFTNANAVSQNFAAKCIQLRRSRQMRTRLFNMILEAV